MLGRNHDMLFLGRDMGSEPDYSDEVAKEIDDEIRRVIEEAHASATTVLRAHMTRSSTASPRSSSSAIGQGPVRAPARGRVQESVFPAEVPSPSPSSAPEAEKKPKLKPQPRPIPGTAAMQPPPPDPAAG